MIRNYLTAFAATMAAALLTTPASANIVDSVTATPSIVNPGVNVDIRIDRSGAGACGARLEYGDGTPGVPIVIPASGANLQYAYSTTGTFRIRVLTWAAHETPCTNTPKNDDVIVRDGPVAGPAGSRAIGPKRPQAGRAPDTSIKGPAAEPGLAPGGSLVQGPVITAHHFEPVSNNGQLVWAAPDVLAPNGRLILVGKGFGANAGDIRIVNSVGGSALLETVFWSPTQVHAIIPDSLGGDPKVRFSIGVEVRNAALDKWSAAHPVEYENPFASRILSMNDRAVRVVSCSGDANWNICNNDNDTADSGCVIDPPFVLGPADPPPAIVSFHGNCGVGDDEGTDVYEIQLANGWFIHDVLEQQMSSSSDAEDVDFPSVPTGTNATNATLDFDWTATDYDSLSYWMRIEVLGPIGTEPF